MEAAFFLLEVYPFEVDLSSAGLAGAQLQDRARPRTVRQDELHLGQPLRSQSDGDAPLDRGSEALFEAPEPVFIGLISQVQPLEQRRCLIHPDVRRC